MDRLTHYLKAFGGKWRWVKNKEVEEFDDWFTNSFLPFLDRIVKEEGLTSDEREKFIDLMYKVMFVKKEFDERYDNVLIHDALKRVKGG